MMVFMQEPSESMHHILVKKPCNSFHEEKGKYHDAQIQDNKYCLWHEGTLPTKIQAVLNSFCFLSRKNGIITIIYRVI